MESELDLNDIIQEMHVVATMPDLYHLLVELNAVQSLLGLLGHDNTDILSDLSSLGRLTWQGSAAYSLLLSVSAVTSDILFPVQLSPILKHMLLFTHLKIWFMKINLGQALIVLFALNSTRIHRDVSVHTLTALIFRDLDLEAH